MGVIIFIFGLLVASINFLFTVSKLMIKQMLKKARVLWISAATLGLATLIFFLLASASSITNYTLEAIAFDMVIIALEAILLVIITTLMMLLSRVHGVARVQQEI